MCAWPFKAPSCDPWNARCTAPTHAALHCTLHQLGTHDPLGTKLERKLPHPNSHHVLFAGWAVLSISAVVVAISAAGMVLGWRQFKAWRERRYAERFHDLEAEPKPPANPLQSDERRQI